MNKGLILFKNKYRIESTRLKYWDYSNSGFYFATICTKNIINYFGEIIDGKMVLNEYGHIVEHYLKQIHAHFCFVNVDSFVIMPNHVHLILQIKYKPKQRRDVALLRLYRNGNARMSIISPKPKSISSIIRSYKSICKRIINRIDKYNDFNWQPRFYEHIIRTEIDLYNIRAYIKNNPKNWDCDRNNK